MKSSRFIVFEQFIGDGKTKTFKANDPERDSIDDSKIHQEFDELKTVRHFFEKLDGLIFNFLGIGNGHFGMEIPKPEWGPKKPGDFDVAYIEETTKNAFGFEVKRVKVSEHVNKLGGLKTAKKQLQGYQQYNFSGVYFVLFVARDAPVKGFDYKKIVMEGFDQYMELDWLKSNGFGLIIIDHAQEKNMSVNTRQLFRINLLFHPQIKSTEPQLLNHLERFDSLKKVDTSKGFDDYKSIV